ncbi:MAG: hypothetical protein ACR2ND_09940, partial [Solirubrobacteraceae bacterium]
YPCPYGGADRADHPAPDPIANGNEAVTPRNGRRGIGGAIRAGEKRDGPQRRPQPPPTRSPSFPSNSSALRSNPRGSYW